MQTRERAHCARSVFPFIKKKKKKKKAKTRCKRGDNATGSINETDAKKRLRARSGHSQKASAKPTAEADKATTKKERGME